MAKARDMAPKLVFRENGSAKGGVVYKDSKVRSQQVFC